MKDEPAEDAKCKDKFLVQTVSVSRDMEFANVTSIVSATILVPISFTPTNMPLVRKSVQVCRPGAQDSRELAA